MGDRRVCLDCEWGIHSDELEAVKITGLATNSGVLELKTDENISGIALLGHGVQSLAENLTRDLLIGEDPRGASGLWQRMIEACSESGATGLALHTLSALDVAIWDLKSKINDEPLWKTLGGLNPRLNAHLNVVSRRDFELAAALGFRAGKIKVGKDPAADQRALTDLCAAMRGNATEPALVIDADERWTPKEAIRALREIEGQFNIAWVEEPVRRWDYLGLKRVSSSIRSAVCSSERLGVVSEYLPQLHHHAVNIVQISLAYGGITGAMQMADAAFGFELPVVVSAAPGNIHAHVGAAIPYCMSVEVSNPESTMAELTSGIRIEHGWVLAADRPGHGLQREGASA